MQLTEKDTSDIFNIVERCYLKSKGLSWKCSCRIRRLIYILLHYIESKTKTCPLVIH